MEPLFTFEKILPSVGLELSKKKKKVKVSHSLLAVGAVGVRAPLYLGHS